MYELNKIAFGSFLAQLRREKGMTQKELAACLYVSDKAVSKNWLHVIKAMRVWCVVSMLLTPLCTEGAVQLEQRHRMAGVGCSAYRDTSCIAVWRNRHPGEEVRMTNG